MGEQLHRGTESRVFLLLPDVHRGTLNRSHDYHVRLCRWVSKYDVL
jgi:hypothetical protein